MEKLQELVEEMTQKMQNGKNDIPKKTPKKYDPSKKYKWEPGTNFYFSGEEFGVLLNSIRTILNTPEAKKIMMLERANFAIENSLSRAVELGEVVEESNEKLIDQASKK